MLAFIINIIVGLIFWIIASILDSVMDTIKDHWSISIFKDNPKYDEDWWNPTISWENKNDKVYWKIFKWKIKRPVQFTDAWHNLKMWKIISLALSSLSLIIGFLIVLGITVWPILIISVLFLIIYGILWNCPFNLFYNKILKKK
jgi:hypothetical protein